MKKIGFVSILLLIINFFPFQGQSQNLDIDWLREINVNRNTALDPTFKVITDSDTPVIIAAPALVFGIGVLKKDSTLTRKGLFMAGSFLVNSVITVGMKYGFNRPRPFVTYPDIQKLTSAGSYSFPSGHASTAFNTATSLSLVFPKWYVIAPSFIWASGVGYSRMHLGVHYPSDVFVGALVGSGTAFLSFWLNKKINWERKKGWFL